MAMIAENWADALNPIVQYWFDLGFRRRESMLSTLYNMKTSQRAYEESAGMGTISPAVWDAYKNSGVVGVADFNEQYKTTYTPVEYPAEIQIKRSLIDDSQFNMAQQIVRKAGDSASLKREKDGASVFNNAFSASFLGADGVALCSDSHPSGKDNATTQDNNFAYSLTKDNVKLVREAMMAFKDDKGELMAVVPNVLLVPPTLTDTALEIANSVLDPTSANNTINAQFGRWQVWTWHYLTDSNAWFMIDKILMKDSLEWFDRILLNIAPKVEDKTLLATWIAYMRYSYGWNDWRWIAGSNPS